MQADVAALKAHRCNRPSCRGPSCAALLKAYQGETDTCAPSIRAAWGRRQAPRSLPVLETLQAECPPRLTLSEALQMLKGLSLSGTRRHAGS